MQYRFHKNAREYIKYSLRFLFHLTKNLTTHLSHTLCAVLPKVLTGEVLVNTIIIDNNIILYFVKHVKYKNPLQKENPRSHMRISGFYRKSDETKCHKLEKYCAMLLQALRSVQPCLLCLL